MGETDIGDLAKWLKGKSDERLAAFKSNMENDPRFVEGDGVSQPKWGHTCSKCGHREILWIYKGVAIG